MAEWEGGGYDADIPYDPDGLSISIRIQKRACEYLEIVAKPKTGESRVRCGWCEDSVMRRCQYKDRTGIICPLDEYGNPKDEK